MTTDTVTPSTALAQFLESLWFRRKVWAARAAGARWCLASAAFVTTLILADHYVDVNPAIRGGVVLLAVAAGVWGAACILGAAAWYRDQPVEFAALPTMLFSSGPVWAAQSQSRPPLAEGLPTAIAAMVEGSELPSVPLLDELFIVVLRDLRTISPNVLYGRAAAKLWISGCLLIALMLPALALKLSPAPLTSLERVAFPWSATPRPTRIVLTVTPGDASLAQRSDLRVTAATIGRLSASPTLLWHNFSAIDGSQFRGWHTVRMQKVTGTTSAVGADQWEATIPSITTDIVYQVRADDAVTPPFRIDVLVMPRPTQWQLTELDTGRVLADSSSGVAIVDFATPTTVDVGTRLRFQARLNVHVDRAVLQKTTVSVGGTTIDAPFEASDSGLLELTLVGPRAVTSHTSLNVVVVPAGGTADSQSPVSRRAAAETASVPTNIDSPYATAARVTAYRRVLGQADARLREFATAAAATSTQPANAVGSLGQSARTRAFQRSIAALAVASQLAPDATHELLLVRLADELALAFIRRTSLSAPASDLVTQLARAAAELEAEQPARPAAEGSRAILPDIVPRWLPADQPAMSWLLTGPSVAERYDLAWRFEALRRSGRPDVAADLLLLSRAATTAQATDPASLDAFHHEATVLHVSWIDQVSDRPVPPRALQALTANPALVQEAKAKLVLLAGPVDPDRAAMDEILTILSQAAGPVESDLSQAQTLRAASRALRQLIDQSAERGTDATAVPSRITALIKSYPLLNREPSPDFADATPTDPTPAVNAAREIARTDLIMVQQVRRLVSLLQQPMPSDQLSTAVVRAVTAIEQSARARYQPLVLGRLNQLTSMKAAFASNPLRFLDTPQSVPDSGDLDRFARDVRPTISAYLKAIAARP